MKASSAEAVPQARHHVVELARAAVALAVLHVLVEPEVQRRVRIGGGDDVPAGAPAADVVERGEAARDVIGRVEGGRAGGDETDMPVACDKADRSVNGSNDVTVWLRLSASIGMFSTAMWSAMKKASNLAVLQRLDAALDVREIEIHVRPGARIAPGAGVDARRPHEGAKVQLTPGRHFPILYSTRQATNASSQRGSPSVR